MRFLLVAIFLLTSNLVFAQISLSCKASYAVGLGHFMNGQTSQELIVAPGDSTENSYHRILLNSDIKNLSATLIDFKEGSKTQFSIVEIPQFSIYFGASPVQNYPEDVPSITFNSHVFLFISCSKTT